MANIPNQKHDASVVEMDARKFLRTINSGAQSQVALFSERIKEMGQRVNAEWRLVSLDKQGIIFEDSNTHAYYQAGIERLGHGRVRITEPKPIKIVEQEKAVDFHADLKELIENIEKDDTRKADFCFNKIARHRFRSSVIPENGLVTTRDGISRYVPVSKTIVNEDTRRSIIERLCEALSETVKVKRGRIVEAVFNSKQILFPVSELTRRRVVARGMRRIASNAYMSEGFQNRIKHIASLLCSKNIKEAVVNAAEFLKEDQEFSLLDRNDMYRLAADALATQGSMNDKLAEDVAKVLYRTNCHVNRTTIIEEWRQVARMTEYAPLVENVRRLSETKDFENDYNSFLHVMFNEDMNTKVAKAKMYLVALKNMRDILANSETDADLVESVDEYIVRLEQANDEVDDATLMEVEELVASTSENLLNDVNSLADYDTIPEPESKEPDVFGDKDLGAAEGSDGGGSGGGGGIGDSGSDFDLPLGAGDAEAAPEAGPEGALGADEEENNDEDLGDLAKALESKQKSGNAIKEDKKKCPECDSDMNAKGVCTECGHGEAKLAEDAQVDLSNVKTDPYDYQAPENSKIDDKYGVTEDHVDWPDNMDQTKESGQKGGKEPAKGDAMGHQECPEDMNVAKDAGHKKNTLKKGKDAGEKLPKSEGLICPECHASHPLEECMTAEGALCPSCGADVYEAMNKTLDEEGPITRPDNIKLTGVGMDRDGGDKGGVAATKVNKSDGVSGGGGSKDGMDGQDGKGVAGKGMKTSDGRSGGGGSKDGMDGQDGKGIAGKGTATSDGRSGGTTAGKGSGAGAPAGTTDEDQYKDPTRRRRMAMPVKGRATLAPTESVDGKNAISEDTTVTVKEVDGNKTSETTWQVDDNMDAVVAKIAAGLEPEMGMGEMGGEMDIPVDGVEAGMEPMDGAVGGADDGMPPDEDDEGGMPGEVGGEVGMPGEGEMPGEGGEVFGGDGEGEAMPGGDEVSSDKDEDEDEDGKEKTPPFGEDEEEEEVEEGKLPAALQKFKFGKKGKDSDKSDSCSDDCPGCPKCEKTEKPVKEDNDIGKPTDKGFDNADTARKDGDGKMMRPKPKWTEDDTAGSKGKPARSGGK